MTSERTRTVALPLPSTTEALGEEVGRAILGGEAIGLSGPLGAGKTTFVRGLARGMGMDPDYSVASPTYVLLQRYPCGHLTLWHLDLYRIGSAEDAESTGYRDALGSKGSVLVVEWPERVPNLLPRDRLEIELSYAGEGRMAELRGMGERHRALVERATGNRGGEG